MTSEQGMCMISFGYQRDKGPVRAENQDQIHTFQSSVYGLVFLVADGMGGHEGGAIASNMAITGFKQHFQNVSKTLSLRGSIIEAARLTNLDIYEKSNEKGREPNLLRMGSTLVICVISDNTYTVAHVGDSRCYSFLNGTLSKRTKDHTAVQKMVDAGTISAEEARHHPDASVLTRAFGQRPEIELDVSEPRALDPDEVLLLCSDGLYGFVEESAIIDCLSRNQNPQMAADALLQLALDAGGHDNVSLYVIRAVAPPGAQLATTPDPPFETEGPETADARPSSAGPAVPAGRALAEAAVKSGPRHWRLGLGFLAVCAALAAVAAGWYPGPDWMPAGIRGQVAEWAGRFAPTARWLQPGAALPAVNPPRQSPAPAVAAAGPAVATAAEPEPGVEPASAPETALAASGQPDIREPGTKREGPEGPAPPSARVAVIIAYPPVENPEFLQTVEQLKARLRSAGYDASSTVKKIRTDGVWRSIGGDKPGFAPAALLVSTLFHAGFERQAARVCEAIRCTAPGPREIRAPDRRMFEENFVGRPIVVFAHPGVTRGSEITAPSDRSSSKFAEIPEK